MRSTAGSDDSAHQQTASSLRAAVTALRDSGADRFNPVRFRYIQALATRSREQAGPVASLLEKKAWEALQVYQAAYAGERADVRALLEGAGEQQPQIRAQLADLFQSGDFKAARRLAGRPDTSEAVAALASLTRELESSPNGSTVGTGCERTEMKALRHHRETLRRQYAERLLYSALRDAPDDAGPLNPRKLALRSLHIMLDTSPACLGHFVSYLETLYWLEQHKDG